MSLIIPLIIGVLNHGEIAIEVKISGAPVLSELKGLSAFCDDYNPKRALVICQSSRKRTITTKNGHPIEVLPWQEFLRDLWAVKYIDSR